MFDADVIEQTVMYYGWFHFGKKDFECPGLGKERLALYGAHSRLPEPCDQCYKALIFWKGRYSKNNLENFLRMIDSFDFNYTGKLNRGVVVFYFRNKENMDVFLSSLDRKMQEYNVLGKTQWRRACSEYQTLKPELWKNAKEFMGIPP
ncbi:MAG: hypothetical protein M1503_00560 [Thaumarchaeota archaeon]|nr:hypothetical protein [Nitrososphaerota archaeon]